MSFITKTIVIPPDATIDTIREMAQHSRFGDKIIFHPGVIYQIDVSHAPLRMPSGRRYYGMGCTFQATAGRFDRGILDFYDVPTPLFYRILWFFRLPFFRPLISGFIIRGNGSGTAMRIALKEEQEK